MMAVASEGRRRHGDWQLPPLMAPRGAREWLWHVGLLGSVLTVVLLPGGPLVAGLCGLAFWLVSAEPAEVVRAGGYYLGTSVLICGLAGQPRAEAGILVATLRWHLAARPAIAVAFSAQLALVCGLEALAIGCVMGFDRRSVRRDLVDERVWERQRDRRLTLVRRWHSSFDFPEVS
jgi:hypothetical protein